MKTLLTPAKLRNLKREAERAAQAQGHAAEVGVYRGGSARVIAQALPDRPLHLFDTFQGLPEPDRDLDGPFHHAGQFAASVPEVACTLAGMEPVEVHYHVGLFPHSTVGLDHLRFCFVHVDVDLYAPVMDCCGWFHTRMNPGGIIIFDDYSAHTTPGCPKAVDAFYGTLGQMVEVAESGPAIVRY